MVQSRESLHEGISSVSVQSGQVLTALHRKHYQDGVSGHVSLKGRLRQRCMISVFGAVLWVAQITLGMRNRHQ